MTKRAEQSANALKGYDRSMKMAMIGLHNDGLISDYTLIGERTYSAHARASWETIARVMAGYESKPETPLLGGQCVPINGVAWRKGRARGGNVIDAGQRGLHVRAMLGGYNDKTGDYERGAIEVCRELLTDNNIECGDLDRWTTGAWARRLWRYISEDKDPYPERRKPKGDAEVLRKFRGVGLTTGGMIAPQPVLLDGNGDPLPGDEGETETEPIGYHDCTPGTYDYAQLWDVRAYYGSFLMRVAEEGRISLRPSVATYDGKTEIQSGAWRDGERERLREVIRHIWDCKPLRNSMVGAALGTYRPMIAFAWDKEKKKAKRLTYVAGPGPFRRLGLVIVRSGSDLCQEQARAANSVYSTVDSVCIPGWVDSEGAWLGARPDVWKGYGFDCSVKAEGPAEICAFGSWGFGKDRELESTVPYQRGEREYRPAPRPKEATHVYNQWL